MHISDGGLRMEVKTSLVGAEDKNLSANTGVQVHLWSKDSTCSPHVEPQSLCTKTTEPAGCN